MQRNLFKGLLAFGLIASLSSLANAHAQLQQAIPGVGSTVASASELKLKFSEGVEIRLSKIEVTDEAGANEAAGLSAEGDKSTVIVHLKHALHAGSYKVTWHVVSVDTHKTQGDYSFTVKP